jgi:dienelactone hydrolase
MKKLLAMLAVLASGCPDVTVDPDETQQGPIVEFDPARSLATKARFIPFPNDLARDPATGKVNLGEQACESPTSKATRENMLNKLDGFGTYQTAMQVSFTAAVDPASLEGNIVMYQLTDQGTPLSPDSATPIPVTVVRVGTTPRFATGDCNAPEMANAVTFVPNVPLRQKSTYFVTLLKGIKDADGKEFTPAYTWGLVASEEPPVVLDDAGNIVSERTPLDPADETQRAQLQSLAMMWQLHAPGLAFYMATPDARPRGHILVGFQFTTQTVTDPLDPMVEGSPASKLASVGILQLQTVTGKFLTIGQTICTAKNETNPTQCFLKLALGGCNPLTTGCAESNFDAGAQACQLLNCAEIGNVLGGGIGTVNYQSQLPNPFDAAKPIQGAWSDPTEPAQQASLILETLVTIPPGTSPMNNGWPVVVFGHGLGSSKEAALAIAGRLAGAKFATVAIDTSAHGSRAVRISDDPALGCKGQCFSGNTPTGTLCETRADCADPEQQTCGNLGVSPSLAPPTPTTAPQCYAPFLSADLAAMRDGIRQTVLDHQRVVKAVKACGTSACAGFPVNANRVYYLGMSLGANIGVLSAAMAPDLKTTVLNVGGVGWADILENTETLQIRCSLVNGLIDAGILVGEKWNGTDRGLCTTDAWKAQPGYATFSAIGRWVLDPADGANYASRLATERLLVQEVVGDTVVPNVATDRLAALTGLAQTPLTGDPFDPNNPAPSAAITNAPMTNKFVRYVSDETNVFVHSSLLRPAPTTDPRHGINGTLRLVTDAITFLVNNP